jgi:DNA repair protein RadA/Sms
MGKVKIIYSCAQCGAQHPKWQGQCADCSAWNTLAEETYQETTKENPRLTGYAAAADNTVRDLASIDFETVPRMSTHFAELDRVLGGGIVSGSVILIGGDPGIGKSTLLLQTLCKCGTNAKSLYITGEESLGQISLRAHRLDLSTEGIRLLAETSVERIIKVAEKEKPSIMVVDSIQTLFTEYTTSAPGSVSQVRESAAQLVRFAKQSGTALFLVGHVTKEGALAGPRVLEHMVDTVLYFEGDTNSRYRIIRAIKNRFGAVNELGIFAMAEKGLQEVNNPSAIFLSRSEADIAGSCILAAWEGTRPLLVEVQALVDESHLEMPRRVAVGFDQNRLSMLLAVLHRHAGIATYKYDVFVNIVGGLRITETAADLPVLLAIVSSLKNRPLSSRLIAFGEVGLGGEIRPIQHGQERLKDAEKHGFTTAIIPAANVSKKASPELTPHGVKTLTNALKMC